MTTQEILLLVTLIVGIGGFLATIFQIKKNSEIKKAEFIERMLNDLRTNELLIEGNYIIEYNRTWYNNDFRHSRTEKCVDALLSRYNYICYLIECNLVDINELCFFEYKMMMLNENESAKNYLWNLYHWNDYAVGKFEFKYLLNYLQKNLFSAEDLAAYKSTQEHGIYKFIKHEND